MGFVEDFYALYGYNVNNLWLTPESNVVETTDPTLGPEDSTLNITMRTLGVTFETIYKNIASYPNVITLNNDTNIHKTYYLENNQTINIETVIENDGALIKTLLTGDTSLTYPILRTKEIIETLDGKTKVNTIYNEIKD